jgi:hypothetical protein
LVCDSYGLCCRACAADDHPKPVRRSRERGWPITAENQTGIRQGNGPDTGLSINGKGNMHRPISAFLAIFSRAIDRINNPDAGFGEARWIILFLFGQQAILGPLLSQGMDQKGVGRGITCFAQRFKAQQPRGANGAQQLACRFGKMGGKVCIGHRHGLRLNQRG